MPPFFSPVRPGTAICAWLCVPSIRNSAGVHIPARPCSRTDVVALNGSLGGLEAQTDILVPPLAGLAGTGSLDLGLAVEEDCITTTVSIPCFPSRCIEPVLYRLDREKLTMRLLLESTLALDCQFGSHLVVVNARKTFGCRAGVVWMDGR